MWCMTVSVALKYVMVSVTFGMCQRVLCCVLCDSECCTAVCGDECYSMWCVMVSVTLCGV